MKITPLTHYLQIFYQLELNFKVNLYLENLNNHMINAEEI